MKKLFLAMLLLAAPLAAQLPVNAALPAWLAGSWTMESGANWADEVWMNPRGGVMLGISRGGFGPELQHWESAQIRIKNDGTISHFLQPQGKAAVEFPMVLVSDDAIEFANPAHDYPQRIRYWRQGKLLMAEVSLIDGSRAERWNFRPVVPPRDQVE
ncbi:MAG: DUF6265 family protein [Novosphingobium sp.]|uniref:DUF6265 family protein n=1 Tax=Novosphingobium sp. TaxID=1874826 RepID=UPI0032B8B201